MIIFLIFVIRSSKASWISQRNLTLKFKKNNTFNVHNGRHSDRY